MIIISQVHQSSCPTSMRANSQLEPKTTRLKTLSVFHRSPESCGPYNQQPYYSIHTHIVHYIHTYLYAVDSRTTSNYILSTMINKIQYFPSFLEKRRKEAEQKQIQRQTQQQINNANKRIRDTNLVNQDFQIEKTVSNDDIVTHGKLLRVKAPTLIETEFRVVCLYSQQQTEVIASREEIIDKNIGALLDYYENKLNLKDKIVIIPT